MDGRAEYEFVVTPEDNVLLVLYAYDADPTDPQIVPDEKTRQITLYRDQDHVISMNEVGAEIFALLAHEQNLLVCEIRPTKNPQENEVVYTYFAEIKHSK